MYKVLIAEDEASARRWVSKIIDWTDLGFELVEVAQNGLEAWNLYNEHTNIDLVITDIHMPEMDGIELVKNIRSYSGNHPEIIILSGYGEFKYAQEALRFQVNDYILKPMSKEQLIELLKKIVSRLENRKLISDNLLYANQQRKENDDKDKQAFYERWLMGDGAGPEFKRDLVKYCLPDYESGMLLYIAELDFYDQLVAHNSETDMNLCRFMIQNIISEMASRYGDSQCIFLAPNQLMVMINISDNLYLDSNGMRQLGLRFQESLKQYVRLFPIHLSLGCVRVYDSWTKLPES